MKRKKLAEAKVVISKMNSLIDLAERAKKVGLTPSKVLGVNPTLYEITEEQIATFQKAIEAAEKEQAKLNGEVKQR